MGRSRVALISFALLVSLGASSLGISGAGAVEYPTAGPVSDAAGELFVAPFEDLIADTLLALGIDPAVVDEIILSVGQNASNELGRMLDDGLVTEAQLDVLAAEVDAGTLDTSIVEIVMETRVRRDAYRAAAVDALADLGVEVADGVPVSQILADNGIDADEFVASLPEDLPPPLASPTTTVPPATTPPPATTVPTTTTPPPPPPTTTAPPATTEGPSTGYPRTAPDHYPVTPPPPAPPAPEYPTTGGDSV